MKRLGERAGHAGERIAVGLTHETEQSQERRAPEEARQTVVVSHTGSGDRTRSQRSITARQIASQVENARRQLAVHGSLSSSG